MNGTARPRKRQRAVSSPACASSVPAASALLATSASASASAGGGGGGGGGVSDGVVERVCAEDGGGVEKGEDVAERLRFSSRQARSRGGGDGGDGDGDGDGGDDDANADASANANAKGDVDMGEVVSHRRAVEELLDRLQVILSTAMEVRDEHLRQAEQIGEEMQARETAVKAAARVRAHARTAERAASAAAAAAAAAASAGAGGSDSGGGDEGGKERGGVEGVGVDVTDAGEEQRVSPFGVGRLSRRQQRKQRIEQQQHLGLLQHQSKIVDRVESTIPEEPSLPALKLLTEQQPSEKLIREQSIIIRAQAITRKNAELARERLPKQPEASRNKTWQDYFLDECIWMATDFREERKWKMQMARKLARSVQQYHVQKANREAKAKLEAQQRTVKVASGIARDVRKFWSQVREIADYRSARVERIRKREESQLHLNKFLERTQMYSNELASRFHRSSQSVPCVPRGVHVKQVRFADGAVGVDPDLKLSADGSVDKGCVRLASDVLGDAAVPKGSDCSPKCHSPPIPNGQAKDGVTVVKIGTKRPVPSEGEDGKPLPEHSLGNGTLRKVEPEAGAKLKVDGHDPCLRVVDTKTAGRPPDKPRQEHMNGSSSPNNVEPPAKRVKVPSSHDVKARLANGAHGAIRRGADRANEDGAGSNARANGGVDGDGDGDGGAVRIPVELLRGNLRDYQRSGMQWLVNLYSSQSNGILADEMGLGKTIQTIALLSWLAIRHEQWGPHLVIVPTSVMVNWEVEFKKWLPGFKILTYFGSMKDRKQKRKGWTDPDMFHVCITSYTLAVQDVHILRRKKWVYLILDEAHNIKNFKSQRWQTLLTLSSQRRLLLTGTPLQNSVMELWSLMHFLMPNLFDSQSEFKDWFSNPLQDSVQEGSARTEVLDKLHSALRPFILRRLKAEVEKGLPPKHEHVVKCHLGKRQRQLYEDFMARSDVVENLNSGDMFKVMNVLMQLRKVCNHPDLFEGRPILSPFAMAPIFYPVPSLVARLKDDDSADRLNLSLLGLDMCSRELVWPGRWLAERSERISLELIARDVLLNRRHVDARILGEEKKELGVAAFRTRERALAFRRSSLYHMAVVSAHRIRERGLLGEDVRGICAMTPSSLAASLRLNSAPHDAFVPSFASDLVSRVETVAQRARHACEKFVSCITKASAPLVEMRYQGDDAQHYAEVQSTMDLSRASSAYRSLFRSYEVRSQVTIPDKRLVQWDCGKLQVLDQLLRRLRARGSRVLIFTQMTKVLDVLESFLNLHTHKYLRLDGTTKADNRQKVVERFNSDKRIFCMILTTRAGGVGLNLTGADCVIFYDTDYNPAIDNQAQDRAHRIGQTRPVHIFRLVCENTVEEGILRRANQKRSLEAQIISEAGFTTDALKRLKPVGHVAQVDGKDHPNGAPGDVNGEKDTVSLRDTTQTNGAADGAHSDIAGQSDAPVNGIESAQGFFRGFNDASSTPDGEGASTNGLVQRGLNGSDDFQRMTDRILAGDDERERLAMVAAEQERRIMEAEFNDVDENVAPLTPNIEQDVNSADDEDDLDLENALTPIQKYALNFMERLQGDDSSDEIADRPCEVDENDDEDVTVGGLSHTESGSKFDGSGSPASHDEKMKADVAASDNIHLRVERGEDDNEDEDLFYELDVTEEGRRNYLKALTDLDVDFKLYLPLRDGGPEELKVSSVVCGTAAAGLECAEDAAFFPHAYNRMSRTRYATKRQKEKSLANYRKRLLAESEARRLEREGSRAVSSQHKDRPGVSAVSLDVDSSRAGEAGRITAMDVVSRVKSTGSMDRLGDPMDVSRGKSSVGMAVGTRLTNADVIMVDMAKLHDTKDKTASQASRSLSIGERSKSLKSRGESSRGAGTRRAKALGISFPSGDAGLFKKPTKKAARKMQINGMKMPASVGNSAAIGDALGCNERWTREEEEQMIAYAEDFNYNMLLVSDALGMDRRVSVGIRQRRRPDHCTERVLKCIGKDKVNPANAITSNSDKLELTKHFQGLLDTMRNGSFSIVNGIQLAPPITELHPTQKRVVEDTKTKQGKLLIARDTILTADVTKGLKGPQHHKPGFKPWETTSTYLRRQKNPFVIPPTDGWHLDGVMNGNSRYGSGVQVSGSGTGVSGSVPPTGGGRGMSLSGHAGNGVAVVSARNVIGGSIVGGDSGSTNVGRGRGTVALRFAATSTTSKLGGNGKTVVAPGLVGKTAVATPVGRKVLGAVISGTSVAGRGRGVALPSKSLVGAVKKDGRRVGIVAGRGGGTVGNGRGNPLTVVGRGGISGGSVGNGVVRMAGGRGSTGRGASVGRGRGAGRAVIAKSRTVSAVSGSSIGAGAVMGGRGRVLAGGVGRGVMKTGVGAGGGNGVVNPKVLNSAVVAKNGVNVGNSKTSGVVGVALNGAKPSGGGGTTSGPGSVALSGGGTVGSTTGAVNGSRRTVVGAGAVSPAVVSSGVVASSVVSPTVVAPTVVAPAVVAAGIAPSAVVAPAGVTPAMVTPPIVTPPMATAPIVAPPALVAPSVVAPSVVRSAVVGSAVVGSAAVVTPPAVTSSGSGTPAVSCAARSGRAGRPVGGAAAPTVEAAAVTPSVVLPAVEAAGGKVTGMVASTGSTGAVGRSGGGASSGSKLAVDKGGGGGKGDSGGDGGVGFGGGGGGKGSADKDGGKAVGKGRAMAEEGKGRR